MKTRDIWGIKYKERARKASADAGHMLIPKEYLVKNIWEPFRQLHASYKLINCSTDLKYPLSLYFLTLGGYALHSCILIYTFV